MGNLALQAQSNSTRDHKSVHAVVTRSMNKLQKAVPNKEWGSLKVSSGSMLFFPHFSGIKTTTGMKKKYNDIRITFVDTSEIQNFSINCDFILQKI